MLHPFKPKSEFGRNVLVLMSGTAIIQIITILISPFLTRLYAPDDFGLYALYLSALTLLTIIATGKYELAIGLPKKSSEANSLMFLTLLLAFLFSSFLMIILILFHEKIIVLINKPDLARWIYLLPLSVLFSGVYLSNQYWLNRQKRFQEITQIVILQGIILTVFSLIFGYIEMDFAGLILSSFIALVISATVGLKIFILEKPPLSRIKIIALMKKYKKFPAYSIISDFFNSFSHQLPIFFIPFLFGMSAAGIFFLMQRMIKIPLSLLSSSIGEVFRQTATYEYMHHGNCRVIYLKTLQKLILLSIVPFMLLFVFSPFLFELIFGDTWKDAGKYTQILIPMFFTQFISSPLSLMYYIAEKQDKDLLFQIQFFIFTLIIFILSYTFNWNIYLTLSVMSGYYSIAYIINLFITYRFSENTQKRNE